MSETPAVTPQPKILQSKEYFGALAKMQSEMKPIPKTGKNPHFKSTYAELDVAASYLYPLLSKHDFSVLQRTIINGQNLVLHTKLVHAKTGEYEECFWPICSANLKQQDSGSALTYSRRYSLMAITGATAEEEDDDGNRDAAARQKENQKKAAPQQQQQQPQKPAARANPITPAPKAPAPAAPKGLTDAQMRALGNVANKSQWPIAAVKVYTVALYSVLPRQLTFANYQEVLQHVEATPYGEHVENATQIMFDNFTESQRNLIEGGTANQMPIAPVTPPVKNYAPEAVPSPGVMPPAPSFDSNEEIPF